jgi:hypothetical protein
MARIVDFLDELISNTDLEQDYERDPKGTMLGYGLTSDQALIVYAGTLGELRDAVQAEVGDQAIVIIMGRMGLVPPP